MDNFANIGKSTILQAIGLQKNYIEILEKEIEVIDYDSSFCDQCKNKQLLQSFKPETEVYKTSYNACQNCPKKQFTTTSIYKKIYHNEKNKYAHNSYKPTLKINAVKILLLMHFYHPDRYGIIRNLNICEFANLLNCNIKTVKYNFELLQTYGYISFSYTSKNEITAYLCDYESYYLPANKGGRGFFVMSKNLLENLLKINSLNTLRIYIRELISIDNLNSKGGPFVAESKTYSEIRRSLPDYCRPNVIRKALNNNSSIFDVSINNNIIRFEICDIFNSKKQKNDCYNNYIQLFNNFINEFNTIVSYNNTNNCLPDKFEDFFIDSKYEIKDLFKVIYFKDFEIEDLSMLALQYSFDIVLYALSSVYKTYILKDKEIKNLGGLVRSIIISNSVISAA